MWIEVKPGTPVNFARVDEFTKSYHPNRIDVYYVSGGQPKMLEYANEKERDKYFDVLCCALQPMRNEQLKSLVEGGEEALATEESEKTTSKKGTKKDGTTERKSNKRSGGVLSSGRQSTARTT